MYKIELLSNYDIVEICKWLQIPLIDVVNKDLLLNMIPKTGCYVINLENSGNGGTHWVALILNEKYVSYYDSFGLRGPEYIREFISRYITKPIDTIYSCQQTQAIESVLCGYFCIYWLYFHLVLHSENHNNKYLMSKFNKIFNPNYRKLNDRILQKLIKNIML